VDEAAFVRWLMVADLKELPTLDDLLGRPAWQRRAACRGLGTQRFVIDRGGSGYTKAKEICAGCPAREDSREAALADDELVGMWGGTTGAERRQMRAARGVA
jgi:WhiB family redox-sensing transcriptional regulator